MPNTYTQLYIQFVFAVKGRQNAINNTHKEEIEKYICGITRNRKHKPLAIYAMPDHLHLLIGLHPEESISGLIREIKSDSTKLLIVKKCFLKNFIGRKVMEHSAIQNHN